MARRRWKCFSEYTKRGYQKKRSRSHRREFVRGGADPKITRFDIGNKKKNDWEVKLGIISLQNKRISHFTLEAIRVSINRRLQKRIGRYNFHLKIRTHPHTVYREHAMMSFAGADRLSSGMRKSFGRPVGRCARVRAGKILLECGCDFKNVETVKQALKIASYKLCVKSRVVLLEAEKPELEQKVPLPHINTFVLH